MIVCGCCRNTSPTSDRSTALEDATRVVGFRFVLPGEGNTNLPRQSGFSLMTQSGDLDLKLLDELKVKEAILTDEQRDRLVAAVYGDHPVTSSAACHDPHHIFIFYDESDRITNVVEICFACLSIRTHPGLEESQWRHHDFRSLARLCDEIEIGMTSGTAEEKIQFWDEINRLGSRLKTGEQDAAGNPLPAE